MSNDKLSHEEKPFSAYAKFFVAGLSGITTATILHPLDFMKIRMQIDGLSTTNKQYTSSLDGVKKIFRNEGIFAFYNGLTASICRQGLATSTRIGIYTTFFTKFSHDDKPPTFLVKVVLGMVAGTFGGMVGTPVDLCLIRMVTDGAKPPSKRFYYRNAIQCVYKIAREHGVASLWKGGFPTIMRGIVFNTVSLSTYSQSKQIFLSLNLFEDNAKLHFTASFISGFLTALSALPVDLIKTRVQQTQKKMSLIQVFIDIFRHEGIFAY
ncbi:mitochondrial dicarboxylate carrier-related [Holotrichia oblita]|uniref:Mitochondrial dicarboxylate carrier-related n=1 Tax=Holotrichia oblita TaxID=644536 RepID=A0ACB9TVW4_HOLOL|nr:mitochondrial dicarboxylate carrier-related [Holotrichia oblita]